MASHPMNLIAKGMFDDGQGLGKAKLSWCAQLKTIGGFEQEQDPFQCMLLGRDPKVFTVVYLRGTAPQGVHECCVTSRAVLFCEIGWGHSATASGLEHHGTEFAVM